MTSPITKSPQDTAMLAACPFCGGRAEWREDPGVCGVLFGLVVDHAEDCWLNFTAFEQAKVTAAWNTRNPPPGVEREAVLEKMLRHSIDAMAVAAHELESSAGFVPEQSRPDMWRSAAECRALATNYFEALKSPPPPIEPDMVADEPPIGGDRVALKKAIAGLESARAYFQQFSDGDFDADAMLAETDAAVFIALYAARAALSPDPIAESSQTEGEGI